GEARMRVTASGPLRRMGQGDSPLESAQRRWYLTSWIAQRLSAYWPLEDDEGSTQATSALPGGPAMSVGGEIKFAGDDSLPGSAPVMHVEGGKPAGWWAQIPDGPDGDWQIYMVVRVPQPPVAEQRVPLAVVATTGAPVAEWQIYA